MTHTQRNLFLICLAALLVRAAMLVFINNAGIDDSLHYYNLGRNLVQGEGFTIEYVWQYLRLYDDIRHPIDYWMPLAGIIAAAGMWLFGINWLAGLVPFLLMGACVPLLVYFAARQYGMSESTSLIAAALAIGLPELVWQSTRILSTTPNMLLMGGAVLLLTQGLQRHRGWAFALAGICAGLAYLNRNDAVLLVPMTFVLFGLYALIGRQYISRKWWMVVLMPLVAAIVVSPWAWRNQQVLGQTGMVESSRIFYFTEYSEHHSYDNESITLERLLQKQTPAEILGKRTFELIAAVKNIITALQPAVIIGVIGGMLLVLWRRDEDMLLAAAPVAILLLGILIAYPLLIPMKSQGGSFKTAFATLIPLFLPFAGYAITQTMAQRAHQIGVTILVVLLSVAITADTLRQETARVDSYHAFVQDIIATLDTLPDVDGDGAVRVMTQDPLGLAYYEVPSVIIPFGTREDIIAVAERYRIDYIMLPTAWTDLDAYHDGTGQSDDSRFVFSGGTVDRGGGRLPAELYAIHTDR